MCKWCRNKRFKRKEDGMNKAEDVHGGRLVWCNLKYWKYDKRIGHKKRRDQLVVEKRWIRRSSMLEVRILYEKKYANHKMMSNVEWNYEDNYSPSKKSHDFIREKLRRQGRRAREAFRVARGFVEATIREKKGTCDVNNQYIKELEATKKQPRCSTNVVWELNQMRSPRILMFGLPNERLK